MSKTKVRQQTHTSRSPADMLRKHSKPSIELEIVKGLKQENEYLKKKLSTSMKNLEILQKRVTVLENDQCKNAKQNATVSLHRIPESRSTNQSENDLSGDDEYVKSWQVLDHHFSEVIRRYHELLAEKDRVIKGLLGKPRDSAIGENPNGVPTLWSVSQCRDAAPVGKSRSEDDPSISPENSCKCNCAEVADLLEMPSGELLSEHFSEVIRRHKHQLAEKDGLIRELREALEMCLSHTPREQQQQQDSEVQVWHHEYRDSKQLQPRPVPSTRSAMNKQRISYGTLSLDEEEDYLHGSTDTFVALDKCQRLEAIANLERLRQKLMQRLEAEEKLDKLYWQTELNRHHELRVDAGDSFNPDCSFNKDFEMLETTRLELQNGLDELKNSAKSKPQIYVKPHLPIEDSESMLKPRFQSLDKTVRFSEQITITTVQTSYDP